MTGATGCVLLSILSVRSQEGSPFLDPAPPKQGQTSMEVQPLPSSSSTPRSLPERGNDAILRRRPRSPHAPTSLALVSHPSARGPAPTDLSPGQTPAGLLDVLGSLLIQASR